MSRSNSSIDLLVKANDDHVHFNWDNSLSPITTVEPGSVVRFNCRDAANGQLDRDATPTDLVELDFNRTNPLTGPIAIEGAQPGDVLEVTILECNAADWGFTGVFPGSMDLGLLSEEFEQPGLHVWTLEEDKGSYVNGIEVPLDPFPGTMGVAPSEDGQHSLTPPRRVGGNLDIKHLTVGATLYLPVEVEHALFSVGDGHAAQGDGEVCVGAIETPLDVTLQFEINQEIEIRQPEFRTSGLLSSIDEGEPVYGTTGISDELMDATKKAVRNMIHYISRERGLSRMEAYILCSVAVDLKINEVVGTPNWVVSAYLSESIFPDV